MSMGDIPQQTKPISYTSSLRSLQLRRLDETSDSRKFRYSIDFDWFERQCKCTEVK